MLSLAKDYMFSKFLANPTKAMTREIMFWKTLKFNLNLEKPGIEAERNIERHIFKAKKYSIRVEMQNRADDIFL